MKPTPTESTPTIWFTGIFVAGFFSFLWTLSLLRLTHHTNGASFFHWNGASDSGIVLIAPLSIAATLWNMRLRLQKARTP